MNYTENYHLPQWKQEDRILMEDFNQMCADIEAGLNKAVSDAAADTANAARDAAAAQSTANTALAKANAAYSPSQQPYVVGTYEGNNDTLTVTLGFKPKFVIVASPYSSSQSFGSVPSGFAMTGGGLNINGLAILDNGFEVSSVFPTHLPGFPNINNINRTYAYIAFR